MNSTHIRQIKVTFNKLTLLAHVHQLELAEDETAPLKLTMSESSSREIRTIEVAAEEMAILERGINEK
jgi:hypothetical protein